MKYQSRIKKAVYLITMIVIILSLIGCSNVEDYTANIYDLDSEAEALVTEPSVEYVITGLVQIDTITAVEIAPEPEQGCLSQVYFASSLVEQSEFDEEKSSAEKGTIGGGCVEFYKTAEEAIKRDEYLHSFDDSIVLNSGSHAVAGTLVIRISNKLEEDKQNELTDNIVNVLTSGKITDELIEETIAGFENEENMIEITFSCEDILNKPFTEVDSIFKELGFRNIEYNTIEMNYDAEEQFDGSVLEVHIDGKSKFEKNDIFAPDVPIIISYVEDERIPIPKSDEECLSLQYNELVNLLTEKGFTNVTAEQMEIEYTEEVSDGSVLAVSINGTTEFDDDSKFTSDAEIIIKYAAKQPEITEAEPSVTEEPTDAETENDEILVWIPTNGGTKYHSRKGCSNMRDPEQVTKEEAESLGFTPCKRCC